MSDHTWIQKIGEDGEVITLSFPILKHVMDTDWRDHALCAKLPKSVFFDYTMPSVPIAERKAYKSLAISTCQQCPVINNCYEFSVCNNEPYGIWAGLTPDERKPLSVKFKATGILESLPTS